MKYKLPYTVAELLQLRAEGKTNFQIARHFRISTSRVIGIIATEKRNALAAQRSAGLRREIAAGDNLSRKLALDDLFCVLALPPRAETVLRQHFSGRGITECSLREVMDLLIPVVEGPAGFFDLMPGYRIKGLGKILYAKMIKALSAVDCGEGYRTEWTNRKARLRAALVATGEYCAHILHGKDPALADG